MDCQASWDLDQSGVDCSRIAGDLSPQFAYAEHIPIGIIGDREAIPVGQFIGSVISSGGDGPRQTRAG